MSTSVDDHAWLLLDNGALYNGMLNSKGQREGTGTQYQPLAHDATPALLRAWQRGAGYKPLMDEKAKHTVLSYEGEWKEDQPHKKGTQYFETGMYNGDFKEGKRHGKGTWATYDGKWKFLPVKTGQANWEDDQMHGIGIIEDADFIHENVIYKKGVCQMPFTSHGPPTSGFETSVLFGGPMRAAKKV